MRGWGVVCGARDRPELPPVKMQSRAGRVALVTGASAGIGRAIAARLAAEGMIVAAVARRFEKLQELVRATDGGRIHAYRCDVTKDDELENLFKQVAKELGPITVLINNAGTALRTSVGACETDKWRRMFDLNVIAVGIASREAIASMKENNIADGYIINISSISSHGIPEGIGKHVYNGTKNALRVITEGLRQELAADKSTIKVSTICPGVVETEIFEVGDWQGYMDGIPILSPESIASATIFLLSTPLREHVADLVLRPLGETLMA